jgi:hypothetical protein
MNINIIKKIIFTILFANFLFSGTLYISRGLDSMSKYYIEYPNFKESGNVNEASFFSETNAIGYYYPVWKKRKINYNVNLGFEYLQNDWFNFISFYTMFNYEPVKEFTASFLAGLNFYDSELEFINNQDYYPDSKSGQVYGLVLSFSNFNNASSKLSLSLEYKIYTFSQVDDDMWADIEYARSGISFGYKF